MNIEERLELHQKWIRNEPGGIRLEEHGADLREADLRGADLDYACWLLWCGSIGVKIDKRIWCQLAYHLCAVEINDPDCIHYRNMLLPIANHFHRVEECGELEEIKEE